MEARDTMTLDEAKQQWTQAMEPAFAEARLQALTEGVSAEQADQTLALLRQMLDAMFPGLVMHFNQAFRLGCEAGAVAIESVLTQFSPLGQAKLRVVADGLRELGHESLIDGSPEQEPANAG